MPWHGVAQLDDRPAWQQAKLGCRQYDHGAVLLMQVKLKHVETGAFLSASAEKRYGRPISGQLEVCGKTKAGKNEMWIATEGVYFPEMSEL